MSQKIYLKVAVPVPLYQVFDYLPPNDDAEVTLQPGMRVSVPFGRRRMVGVLMATTNETALPAKALKRAYAVLDMQPCLPQSMLELCTWSASYYHHPVGEVVQAALPVQLRGERGTEKRYEPVWQLTEAGRVLDPETLSRAPRQRELLIFMQQNSEVGYSMASLRQQTGKAADALPRLLERSLVLAVEEADWMISEPRLGPKLNTEQQTAVDAIPAVSAAQTVFSVNLLQGVTGSGKTEVYLELVARTLAAGRQALVMTPEIGLTPQLVERFRQRLGARLVVMHSGLSDSERLNAWLEARDGEAQVVLGTRSAIFTPMEKLGLVIVDESHDLSYKQQEGFRYSARDLAVRRGQRHDCPVVLGSATPTLESLHNASEGRYQLLRLPYRTGNAIPPKMSLIDLRNQPLKSGLSRPLLSHMQTHLDDEGQVLLFLNRRGYTPQYLCHLCGWVAGCNECEAHMTWHRQAGQLRCHHCGAQDPAPVACPSCGANEPLGRGLGTQRIEETLQGLFPSVLITRVDRDTVGRRGVLHSMLDEIHQGGARILIGTQMLAKGHDFPDLTLVGVLDADGGLYSPDFRGPERMAQLVTQVAGRAGRSERPGEVLIQTHHPDHPLLQHLVTEGYEAFAEEALRERRDGGWPPFAHLALLRASAVKPGVAMSFLQAARDLLPANEVEILGPVPAPMERRAGRYRAQLLLRSAQRKPLHHSISTWLPGLADLPDARRARWSIDIDPVDLY